MPIIRSSIKDVRRIKRRTAHNAKTKKALKDLAKKLHKAIAADDKSAIKDLLPKIQKAWAKAAKTQVIHGNKANRKISAAMRAMKK